MIKQEIEGISTETLKKVCKTVISRINHVVSVNSEHILQDIIYEYNS